MRWRRSNEANMDSSHEAKPKREKPSLIVSQLAPLTKRKQHHLGSAPTEADGRKPGRNRRGKRRKTARVWMGVAVTLCRWNERQMNIVKNDGIRVAIKRNRNEMTYLSEACVDVTLWWQLLTVTVHPYIYTYTATYPLSFYEKSSLFVISGIKSDVLFGETNKKVTFCRRGGWDRNIPKIVVYKKCDQRITFPSAFLTSPSISVASDFETTKLRR